MKSQTRWKKAEIDLEISYFFYQNIVEHNIKGIMKCHHMLKFKNKYTLLLWSKVELPS